MTVKGFSFPSENIDTEPSTHFPSSPVATDNASYPETIYQLLISSVLTVL